ncbi:hypothetical protein [Leifsonia aquatica]|uniref:hypothetical protein n=1 Tax=Leifsonia aquatica TaxID=144185 RepID=UPI0004680DC5|nr:hypothetical protein [Leifsonia aquatica]
MAGESVMLMGRADVTPEFMPQWGVRFEDPIAEQLLERGDATPVAPVCVHVYRQTDGAIVVQIDHEPLDNADARIRVNVNDGTIFDQNIETGEYYGTDPE